MTKTKSSKIKMFHTLLYRTYMMANKPDMLRAYGVESTNDLNDDELDRLIVYLQNIDRAKRTPDTEEKKGWRHKVLRMVAKCGVDTQDWNRVNAFMCQPRIAGKHLYECSVDELKALHRKLHNVASNRVIQCEKELLKAMMN